MRHSRRSESAALPGQRTPVGRAAGFRLARDLPPLETDGPPFLRAGTTITPRSQRALTEAGVREVWVLEEQLPELTRQRAGRRVVEALEAELDALTVRHAVDEQALAEVRTVVELIGDRIARSPDLAMAVDDLADAGSEVDRHSLVTCALGLLLGRAVFARRGATELQTELADLGLGLLLHDIGKLALPAPLLEKCGLTKQEWTVIRSHPDAGLRLLPPTLLPVVKEVVVGHHERWNGTGYPRGLKGRAIHPFARIAAVADVFDEVTTERPYRPAATVDRAIAVIRDGRGRAFDPQVVDVFLESLAPVREPASAGERGASRKSASSLSEACR